MPFIGAKPATVPLTSADLEDNIITSAKIVDGAIVNADINASAAIAQSKLSGSFGVTAGTPITTSSGTSHDFTGIPSTAKIIWVVCNGVYKDGSTNLLVQIGDSGGIETSGYLSRTGYYQDNSLGNSVSSTAGFPGAGEAGAGSTLTFSGTFTLTYVDTSNIWTCTILGKAQDDDYAVHGGGQKTLSGTLDRVRITTVSGSATFGGGTVNILYM